MALPVCRWYLTSITDQQFDWGVRVTVTTDVAVHLYMRYSDNFPRIHAATREHRGVVMWGGVYHCFTAYHHIEQNEEGDTTTHTFDWPGWVYCETRYFYFFGHTNYLECVSDSPVFWIHYHWTPPPSYDDLAWFVGAEDDLKLVWASRLVCQSFVAVGNPWVYRVGLKFRTYGGSPLGLCHYTIRNTSDWIPNSTPMWEDTFPAAWTWGGAIRWHYLDLEEPIQLAAGETYYLCCQFKGASIPLYWHSMGSLLDEYPTGEWLIGVTDEGPWHQHLAGEDIPFWVWGWV